MMIMVEQLYIVGAIIILSFSVYFGYFKSVSLLSPPTPTDSGHERRKMFKNTKNLQKLDYKHKKSINYGVPTEKLCISGSFFERNEEGFKFHVQIIKPVPPVVPKAVICFVHGYSSGAIYHMKQLCDNLSSGGFVVIAMDGRGHGLSDGLHCYIPDFEQYVEDYYQCFKRHSAPFESLNKFLFGISMGGAVCLHLLEKDRKANLFKGAILSSPMVKIPAKKIPNRFVYTIFVVCSYIFPSAKITPAHYDDKFYNDDELASFINAYPLTYHCRARLRTTQQLLWASKMNLEFAKNLDKPILVMHGKKDKITSSKDTKKFFKDLKCGDKELKLFKKERHGLFFDSKANFVFEKTVNWIKHRC